MKFKPLIFNQLRDWRWTCYTPIGIFVIDTDDGEDDKPNYNCYLEQELSIAPENSIAVSESLEDAQKECQKYFEGQLKTFLE